MSTIRHITLPGGFAAAGAKAGIKASGREDVALFVAEHDAAAALLTTSNQIVGAPVLWCRRVLPRGYGKVRAFVVNSGCSNVCTGKRGEQDAQTMAGEVAKVLHTRPTKVLVASTGVIGRPLPMAKVRRGIGAAVRNLGRNHDAKALRAIMTTDTRQKSAVVRTRIGGKAVTVAGIIKGAGMIAPSLATMICVVTTDAAVSPAALHKALKAAADETLDAVTIDSDTSTSDTVVAMASGAAGNARITSRSPHYRKLAAALREVLWELSRAMAADGEGATRLVIVDVRGARSAPEAKAAAKSVADSPLVKTAVHGQDPNWGRIAMALGKSSAKIVAETLHIRIGPTRVFARGRPTRFDAKAVSAYLGGKEIRIVCDLGLGKAAFTALTCDLSREYITINADYTT